VISRDTYIELTKFGIVGSICFGMDLGLYYFLTEVFSTPTFVAKSVSVVSATFLNYYLNKTWTWGHDDHSRFGKYLLLYAVSGLLNVLSNEIFLHVRPDKLFQMYVLDPGQNIPKPFFSLKLDKFLAVIAATGVGMVVNFIGQKLWVFKIAAVSKA
jgi:putative flippase GtrA